MRVSGGCDRENYTILLDGNEKSDVLIPSKCNMGYGELILFTVCLNCGRMQGEWPARQDIVLSEDYTYSSSDDDIPVITLTPGVPTTVTFG